ncbi:alpha-L-rhamnosidase, partial [mine drainage metagenome]
MTTLIPTDLRCEFLVEPLGIDTPRPRFIWVLEVADPARRGVRQTAYQIVVTDDAGGLAWDSGRIASDQTVNVEYGGEPLGSGRRYHWKARVWDEQAAVSEWSESASWTMGLLKPADWRAKWIGEPVDTPWTETQSPPATM